MGFVSSESRKKIWAGVLYIVNQQLEVGYDHQSNKKKLSLLIYVSRTVSEKTEEGEVTKDKYIDGRGEGWRNGWIDRWMETESAGRQMKRKQPVLSAGR